MTATAHRITTGGLVNYLGTDYPIQHATVAGTGAATTEAVAAVAGKKIRVVGYAISTSGTYVFVSDTASPAAVSAIHQATSFAVPFQNLPIDENGYFESASGENLGITHSANCQADIWFIETLL